MKQTQLLLVLLTITVVKHDATRHADILQTKSIFQKTNEEIHHVMNRILKSLSIGANITATPEMKLLLTMHNGLNNIAEKICEVYNKIRNAVKVNADSKPARLSNLSDLLNEIFEEKEFIINLIEIIFNETENKINNTGEGDVKSEEINDFLNDFLIKLHSLTIRDVVDKTSNSNYETSDEDEDGDYETNIILKIWDNSSNEAAPTTRRTYSKQSEKHKYPLTASVHVLGDFACAGAVISTNLVITAGSCLQLAYNSTFYEDHSEAILIRVASDYKCRGGKLLPVVEVYFHPEFNPMTLFNNLASVQIKERLKFSKPAEKIRRTLLDFNSNVLPISGELITVFGWGVKDETKIMNPFEKISYDVLDVYEIDVCKDLYTSRFVTDKNFCAGHLRKNKKRQQNNMEITEDKDGVCITDIGGPAIVNGVLRGVVSFAPSTCGSPNSPTVFTNLGYYNNWIENIVNSVPIIDPLKGHNI